MLIELPYLQLLLIDILAWFCFHMAISLLMLKVPDSYYQNTKRWFLSFNFERQGEIWDDLFNVRQWKDSLPDSSAFLKNAYNKKQLPSTRTQQLEKFIIETKRAEHTHWLSILPAPLFFLWNPVWAGWIMILYSLLANLPFILIQRYNRPRLERVAQIQKRREYR